MVRRRFGAVAGARAGLEADHETVESVDDDDDEVNETELSVASDCEKRWR